MEEQDDIINIHIGFYTCNICDIYFYDEETYISHNDTVHRLIEDTPVILQYRQMKYKCNKCKEEYDEDIYDDHVTNCVVFIEDVVPFIFDTIPTNRYGRYICPICSKKYISENHLGEHFLLSHNNYADNSHLDERVQCGFPGFDLLEMIGMIHYINIYPTRDVYRCPICYDRYKDIEPLYFINYLKTDNLDHGYNSDSELYYKDIDDAKKIKKYRSRKIGGYYRNITDSRLIAIINKYRDQICKPIYMKCCRNNICETCIREYITQTDSVICPFCKYDHTKSDVEYITIIEPGYYDDTKWRSWWERHVDIFM